MRFLWGYTGGSSGTGIYGGGTYADALTIECVYNDTTNTYTFKKVIDLPLGI